jgi:hypothetical protein
VANLTGKRVAIIARAGHLDLFKAIGGSEDREKGRR